MKIAVATVLGAGLVVLGAESQTIILKGDNTTTTTGELITGARDVPVATNVHEIAGLVVTAHSGSNRHEINTTASAISLGIDDKDKTVAEGDTTTRLDPGEVMTLSFNKTLQISAIDMVGFNSNSLFVVAVDGQAPLEIGYADLPNKTSQIFYSNLVIEAGTEIGFYVGNTNSVIGLQAIDVTVLEGAQEIFLTLASSNGMAHVAVEFAGVPTANYVLQRSGHLASNDWQAVSAPFSTNADWMVDTANPAGFFRVVPAAP